MTARPKNILVADDEEDVLKLVSSNLKNAGFGIIAAKDGATALEMARTEFPALIVLDLMLPGMSGLGGLQGVAQAEPATARIPIIMLTAKAEEIDRIVGLELGADDYVTKPFSPRELVLRVKSAIRRVEGSDEPADTMQAGEIMHGPAPAPRSRSKASRGADGHGVQAALPAHGAAGRVQTRENLLNEVWGYEWRSNRAPSISTCGGCGRSSGNAADASRRSAALATESRRTRPAPSAARAGRRRNEGTASREGISRPGARGWRHLFTVAATLHLHTRPLFALRCLLRPQEPYLYD